MVIATQVVTVTQAGRPVAPSGSLRPARFPVGGGNRHVYGAVELPWQPTTNVDWISVGKAVPWARRINYTVAENKCVGSRLGTIALITNLPNPPALAVTQDGSPRQLTLSASSATADATANNYRITVTTGDVCDWSAVPDVNWIQITVGATGNGHRRDFFPSSRKHDGAARTGSIHVGALTYTITQQAPARRRRCCECGQRRQLQYGRGFAGGNCVPVRQQSGSGLDCHAAGE